MGTQSKRKSQVFDKTLDCFVHKRVKGSFGKKKLTEVEFTYTDLKTGEKSQKKMIIGHQ